MSLAMRRFSLILALALLAPPAVLAADGSLERCGAPSAPAAEAVHHCRRALSLGGLTTEQEFLASLNLGDALLAMGQASAALDAFEAAAATGLSRVELPLGRAQAREALGDRLGAAKDLDAALALAPRSVDVRLVRGAFWLRLGRADAAFEEFDAAVRLDGGDVDARYNRGLTLLALGRAGDAEADFSRVLRDAPNDSGARLQRGRTREGRDDAAALADYQAAAELAPEWPEPWFRAGKLLDRLGRKGDADRNFRRAFELGMKDPWLLERMRALGG